MDIGGAGCRYVTFLWSGAMWSATLLFLSSVTASSGILLYITYYPLAQIAAFCSLKINLKHRNLYKDISRDRIRGLPQVRRTTLRTLPPPGGVTVTERKRRHVTIHVYCVPCVCFCDALYIQKMCTVCANVTAMMYIKDSLYIHMYIKYM